MQGNYIPRQLEHEIQECLQDFPVVALLGPRQCGKSTLAKALIKDKKDAVYLDLERPADLHKLSEPELFFAESEGKLFCLDEIQRIPELFAPLRSIVDTKSRNGQFLLLGSASRDLIQQSSESLAGRIAYLELSPLLFSEVAATGHPYTLNELWVRGGFPDSLLSRTEKSSRRWRENFIRTFLERDIPQLGFHIPAKMIQRVWQMCAHNQGQLLNSSQLGSSLGVSHTTLRSYIDLLEQTFMVRVLQPFSANIKKRLVKSPKVYLRDSGILHTLLKIDDYSDLLGHPVFGASWETIVLENIIAAMPDWKPFFYRTAAGAEIDLLLIRGERRIAIECKASMTPGVTRGFWNALDDLNVESATIIAPVEESYPLKKNVTVSSLASFIKEIRNV
jgi:predicted AAA+ superfamily ATPase